MIPTLDTLPSATLEFQLAIPAIHQAADQQFMPDQLLYHAIIDGWVVRDESRSRRFFPGANLNTEWHLDMYTSGLDSVISDLRSTGYMAIADRIIDLRDIANLSVDCQPLDTGSARTMFDFLDSLEISRPVIGLDSYGLLEARWDNHDETASMMFTFLPGGEVWFAFFDDISGSYDTSTLTVEATTRRTLAFVSSH